MSIREKNVDVDEVAAGALAALRRARVRAEQIARASGIPLVEARNGLPVLVDPNTFEDCDDQRPAAGSK